MTRAVKYKFDHDDPRCYENQPSQNSVDTATVYTVHVPFVNLEGFIERLLDQANLPFWTGEYCITDHKDWSEEPQANMLANVHVYIAAKDPETADARASLVGAVFGYTGSALRFVDVSTSGDWAELASVVRT